MRLTRWYLLAMLMIAGGGGFAAAQESPQNVADLRARLDLLEQQNAVLLETISQRLPPLPADNGDTQYTNFAAGMPATMPV